MYIVDLPKSKQICNRSLSVLEHEKRERESLLLKIDLEISSTSSINVFKLTLSRTF